MKLITTHGKISLFDLLDSNASSSYIKGTHLSNSKTTVENLLVGIPSPIVPIVSLTNDVQYIDSEFYNTMKDYFVSTDFALLSSEQSQALATIDIFIVMISIKEMKNETDANIKNVFNTVQDKMNEY